MKKVYYTEGPGVIKVGPKGQAVKMFAGEPHEFDEETAARLLAKPMFREWPEAAQAKQRAKTAADRDGGPDRQAVREE